MTYTIQYLILQFYRLSYLYLYTLRYHPYVKNTCGKILRHRAPAKCFLVTVFLSTDLNVWVQVRAFLKLNPCTCIYFFMKNPEKYWLLNVYMQHSNRILCQYHSVCTVPLKRHLWHFFYFLFTKYYFFFTKYYFFFTK